MSSCSILSLLSYEFCSCPSSSSHSGTRSSFTSGLNIKSSAFASYEPKWRSGMAYCWKSQEGEDGSSVWVIPLSSGRAEFQTHFKTSDWSHFLSRLDPLTNLLNIKQLPFMGAFRQPDKLESVKKFKFNKWFCQRFAICVIFRNAKSMFRTNNVITMESI